MKPLNFLFLAFLALAPIGYYLYQEQVNPNPNYQVFPVEQKFPISAIKVLSGHEFEILIKLSNGQKQWVHGKLEKTVVADAKDQVIEILNKVNNPQIVLLQKVINDWIVQISFEYEGKQTNLLQVLSDKQLVFY